MPKACRGKTGYTEGARRCTVEQNGAEDDSDDAQAMFATRSFGLASDRGWESGVFSRVCARSAQSGSSCVMC